MVYRHRARHAHGLCGPLRHLLALLSHRRIPLRYDLLLVDELVPEEVLNLDAEHEVHERVHEGCLPRATRAQH